MSCNSEKRFSVFSANQLWRSCCCLVLALPAGFFACAEAADNAPAQGVDTPAPDFSFDALNGERVTLSEHRGSIVLLSFWATWCGPCRTEQPILNETFEKFSSHGLTILGVSVESNDLAVELWVENFRVPYTILRATEADKEVLERYTVDEGIPLLVLIDSKGNIHKEYRGIPDDKVITHDIESLFARSTEKS